MKKEMQKTMQFTSEFTSGYPTYSRKIYTLEKYV